MSEDRNLVWQTSRVERAQREHRNGHRGCVIWLTGYSGAGKSTLANALDYELYRLGYNSYVCDGDNLRHGLCQDLGFSAVDRSENIRRAGELAKLMLDLGVIVITALISPYRSDRARSRRLVGSGEFIEVYCRCPIEICEQRDVKGLYGKARKGEIASFTGISAPYEIPEAPEIIIDSHLETVGDSVKKIIVYLRDQGIIPMAEVNLPFSSRSTKEIAEPVPTGELPISA